MIAGPACIRAGWDTPAHYTAPQAVVARNASQYPHATSLSALANAKIGVQIGTTSLDAVNGWIKPKSQPKVFNDSNDGAAISAGSTVLVLGPLALLVVTSPGWSSVRATFSWSAFPDVLRGFWPDVKLFLIVEAFVLALGPVVALCPRRARRACARRRRRRGSCWRGSGWRAARTTTRTGCRAAAIRDLKAQGMTMIIAAHEMGFAREVADEVCFLHEGLIAERGRPETQRFLRRLLEARRL
jgi:hypothetical protein